MARWPAKRLCFALAFLVFLPLAKAQKPSVVSLLPTSSWRVLSNEKVGLDVIRSLGGDPAIEREYGVKSVERRRCQLGNVIAEVIVEPSPDATTAFGLLTYYRSEAMKPVAGVPLAVAGPDGAVMARGRYFFRLPRSQSTAAEISETDMRNLLSVLANSHPPGATYASLPDALPRRGLIPGSEKYLLGDEAARHVLPSLRRDLIGFAQGAEVHMGAYRTAHGRATVLAIAYPTSQIARARYAEMERMLALNEDHGAGSVYGRRLASYIVMVPDSDSAATAKSLIDMFGISGRVVKNERYPGDKSVAVQMMELIVANLIFVFILSGIAVGGGVIIFLSKRFAQRWLPETQWGQQDARTIITLNLS